MNLSAGNQKRILCAVATLIPVILMMFLYQGNAEYVLLSHMMLAGFLMALVSAAIYGAALWLYKDGIPAMAGTVIAWVVFFRYGVAYQFLNNEFGIRHRHLLPIALALAAGVFFLLKYIAAKLKPSGSEAVSTVCVFMCVLLVWNAFGVLTAHRKAHKYDGYQNNLVKTDFNVDGGITNLPDIYWIHCDGMLGFDSMEKYFGDSQPDFSAFLADNGFQVNRRASFEANHRTAQAVPTLMCPGFYDAVTQTMNQGVPKDELLNNKMLYFARINNEIIHAFTAKGYKTVLISAIYNIFSPVTNIIYETGNRSQSPRITDSDLQSGNHEEVMKKIDSITNIEGLYFLLRDDTLISAADHILSGFIYNFKDGVVNGKRTEIPAYAEDVAAIQERDTPDPEYYNAIRGLLDSRDIDGPKLVIMNFFMAHCPFVYDENGNKHTNNADTLESYPPHHTYSAKVLKNTVAAILEKNPDAIIILQADHGLHEVKREDIMKAFGSEEAVADIWNGVMSAVRIPGQYGTPSEPLEPLDISRYLINNYVGQNYEYLNYGK